MSEPVKVLYVDDDADLVELGSRFIEQYSDKLNVETHTDSGEAARRLRTNGVSVDCVVSDYDMPDPDGLELLQVVRRNHPSLPFILFTGKGSEEIASEAISLGVTDYMQKEIGSDQYQVLANRIENVAERRRAVQERDWSESVFQTLADQNIVGIFIIQDRNLEFINHTYADIFGYDRSELIGKRPRFVAAKSDREKVEEKVGERLSGEMTSHHYRFEGKRKDGSTVQIEVHGGRTTLDGEPATVGALIEREEGSHSD